MMNKNKTTQELISDMDKEMAVVSSYLLEMDRIMNKLDSHTRKMEELMYPAKMAARRGEMPIEAKITSRGWVSRSITKEEKRLLDNIDAYRSILNIWATYKEQFLAHIIHNHFS